MAVTRIKNNQITDSTITYAKIASGTLVGSNFNANLTLNSNVSIIGNLSVTGTTSTVSSTNTYVNDPLVVFNNGYVGSLTGYDIGILVNRNLSALAGYGSVNTAWVWVEADSAFEALATTDTGGGVTSINNSGFANIKVGNITATNGTFSGTISGSITGNAAFTTLTTTNFSSGNARISGGYADAFPIGANTAATGAFTTLATSGVTTHAGNVVITSGADTVSTTTGALVITGTGGASIASNVYVGNNLYIGSTALAQQANFANPTIIAVDSGSNYAQIALKNTNANGSADFAGYADNGTDAGGWVDVGIAGSTYNDGNYTITKAQDGSLMTRPSSNTYGGNLILATSEAGSYNDIVIGVGSFHSNAEVARFHGNTSNSGYFALKQTTAATNTTSGALQVTGGAGISGALYAGSLNSAAAVLTTAVATNFSTGNAVITGGSITGANGQFATLTATNFSSGNIVGILTGTASTANVSLYDSVTASTTNATFYPQFTDRATTGNSAAYVNSSFSYNPSTGILSAPGTSVTASTTSTTSSSGALIVTGGAGIGGNLNVGGNAVITGNLTVQGTMTAIQSTTLDVTDLNITVAKGAATAAAADGAGITVDTAGATILYTDATKSWNLNRVLYGTGAIFSNANASTSRTTGAVILQSGGLGVAGNIWASNLEGTTIGQYAAFPITGSYITASTGFATGNAQITGGNLQGLTYLQATNFSTGNALITGGSISATSGVFTTLSATNFSTGNAVISGGSLNNTPIGASTASTGAFTSLSTTLVSNFGGNVLITSSNDTVTATSGALIINNGGGASISGNVYVAKDLYVGAGAFNTALTNPSIVASDSGATYIQVAAKNTASSGSADFAAYGETGTDAAGWVDMGFTGTGFNDSNYTITRPNDGYVIVRPTTSSYGGNLVLGTSEVGSYNDIVFGVGSFLAASEVARFHGNVSNGGYFALTQTTAATSSTTGALRVTGGAGISGALYNGGVHVSTGNVVAASTTDSTSTTTGALVVAGGVGIAGNVYHGKAAVFNSSQTAGMDFKVAGVNSTNLLWAKPGTYDQVMIGNTAAVSAFVAGAKLQINSTDSILLPAGTTAQRPGSSGGTDTTGMFRYNTTLNSIEYYGGSTPGWQQISTQFTVIADEQFNGDGTTTVFTLNSAQTTNSCIVSINGVIQIPTLAYAVTSGTTLTFTEAPASGDVIDVRKLTTTQTITQIASNNGYDVIASDNTAGLQFYTGSAAQTLQYTLDTSGAWVTQRANVAVASANSATAIDSFATATYRSAKYVIQATAAGKYQIMEALVIHDDTTATIVPYGIVQTNGNVGVLTASLSAGTLSVNFIGANANTNVRVRKEYSLI